MEPSVGIEPKNISPTKNILQKFKKEGNLVVDAYARTYLLLNICMLMQKQRKVIECKIDLSSVNETIPNLIFIHNLQA